MSEFRARISRVRMKAGGADISIIEGSTQPDDDMMDMRGDLFQAARSITESVSDLTAFIVIGIDSSGADYTAASIGDDCPIPCTLMPAFIAELVRQSVLSKPVARQLFSTMFEWQE